MAAGIVLASAGFVGTAIGAAASAPLSIGDRLGVLKEYPVTDARLDSLDAKQKKVLSRMIEASKIIDEIFLEQMDPRNRTAWLPEIGKLAEAEPYWNQYSRYFKVSYGPWDVFFSDWILPTDRFEEVPAFPGKNLYPADLYEGAGSDPGAMAKAAETKLNDWLAANPEDAAAFRSPFSVIRRNPSTKRLEAVPYSVAYKDKLEKAAGHLEDAAGFADEPALAKLLRSRAEAFRTNAFNETEGYWIAAHDTDLQLTIGPYEEYMDGVWGLKRGFSARIALKDHEGTAELKRFEPHIPQFQRRIAELPVERMYIGDEARRDFITMANEVYIAGEARQGAQTLAHKLPNDQVVVEKHGSRRVLFRNILDGKCEHILKPIAAEVMARDLVKHVSCDSFTKQVLHHESAHALGPGYYYPKPAKVVAGWDEAKRRAERKEFGEVLGRYHSPLEEAKADTLSIFIRRMMFDKGWEKPKGRQMEMYATYLAGFFRTVRFGRDSAHRKGVMLQFNKLRELGAIDFGRDGRVRFNTSRIPKAVEELATLILTLQSNGDPKAVEATLEKYGAIPPEMQKLLDKVAAKDIPRDLYPTFPVLAKSDKLH